MFPQMMFHQIVCCFLILVQPTVSFPKFYGEWTLWHSTVPDLPDNRVVVHIYPDNQLSLSYRFMRGPVVYHKSKTGTYHMFQEDYDKDDEKRKVDVLFHHTEEIFLSVYGMGLQNFNIKTKKKSIKTKYSFSMTMPDTDDIYLQSIVRNDDCFHMIRSVRINEPSVDIPISTFLITQVLGTILGHVINQVLFHTN
jgi:hypothetical protein